MSDSPAIRGAAPDGSNGAGLTAAARGRGARIAAVVVGSAARRHERDEEGGEHHTGDREPASHQQRRLNARPFSSRGTISQVRWRSLPLRTVKRLTNPMLLAPGLVTVTSNAAPLLKTFAYV